MAINIGDTLVLYTARDGKLNVHKGIVVRNPKRYTPVVIFEDRRYQDFVPKESKVGRIIGYGPKLWMYERDDELARKMFLEYEMGKLEQLEKQIERKKRLIEVLRED